MFSEAILGEQAIYKEQMWHENMRNSSGSDPV